MLAIGLRDTATAHAVALRDFKDDTKLPSRCAVGGAVIAPLDEKAAVDYLYDIPKYSTL
jgi:hypothetical protein